MDKEIYEIIMKVLNEENLNSEYNNMELLIKEIIEENDLNKKTDLLKAGLVTYDDLYNDETARSKLSMNTINMICLVYYKLFFDSVLKLDEDDILTFIQVYTLFKLSGINDSVHAFLRMLCLINDILETNIKQSFNEYEKINENLFEEVKIKIEDTIDSYKDDDSNWNKLLANRKCY